MVKTGTLESGIKEYNQPHPKKQSESLMSQD